MAWYDSDWPYRVPITVDNTKVSGDLTEFPMLLTETNMPAHFWANVKSDGSDIVLTESDGTTKLYRELVDIDTDNETMELWVNTDLADASDTTIYLYYGNSAGAETNDTETWNANYLGVYHLDETSGFAQDSTSYNHHMDYEDGTITKNSTTQTLWGKTSWYFNIGRQIDQSFKDALTDFTATVWFYDNPGNQSSFERLVDKHFLDGFWFGRNSTTGQFGGGVIEPNPPYGVYVDISAGVWHQIVTRREGTAHYVIRDGGAQSANNVVSDAALSNDDMFAIGGWGRLADTQQRAEQIYMEEVRITGNALSNGWITTEYNNTMDISNFYSVGSLQGKDPDLPLHGALVSDGFKGSLSSDLFSGSLSSDNFEATQS